MINTMLSKRALMTFMVIVMCVSIVSLDAEARGGGRYYHHGGRYHYGPGWFWFGAAATALTVGAILDSMPRGYTTVVVGGTPYYYFDGLYYRPCPQGYVVVPAPVVQPAPVAVVTPVAPAAPVVVAAPQAYQPANAEGVYSINIPNAKGGYTQVTLKRSGSGYVGPQGEYYNEFPTVDQLQVMYGK